MALYRLVHGPERRYDRREIVERPHWSKSERMVGPIVGVGMDRWCRTDLQCVIRLVLLNLLKTYFTDYLRNADLILSDFAWSSSRLLVPLRIQRRILCPRIPQPNTVHCRSLSETIPRWNVFVDAIESQACCGTIVFMIIVVVSRSPFAHERRE